ncbi:MAG: 2-dehydro-3-deoxyglucarate aldolase, partial [Opitutae bacterium]|nr:2-dehydro-3-deoxyglucarate aldolase [Opitutae bacterium]
ITVLAQIESKEGLRNVDEIASVEGVDGLFVGPSDLSADLGCFPDTQHPKVQGAIREILRAGAATGTAVGTIAVVEEQARRYLDMGMTCVAVGADLGLLKNVTQELRNKFRSND